MMGERDCMYYLPHELTGGDEICGIVKTFCNCYGKNCVAFKRHTKESRAELAKAIEIRKKQREAK